MSDFFLFFQSPTAKRILTGRDTVEYSTVQHHFRAVTLAMKGTTFE